jgi:hypothetical protein
MDIKTRRTREGASNMGGIIMGESTDLQTAFIPAHMAFYLLLTLQVRLFSC